MEVTMSETPGGHAASDVEYNIITTLSNLLEAHDVLEQYAADAEADGNTELQSLFNDLRQSNADFAQRFREQLHHLMHH
jgi:hypothetical protein